ncbi:NPC intracellular cholesterol transporter 2-like [Ptychodera flava]|uniref:NPC intracellular cholesterol transporter 2-like n=1 Tax=Ptychodera flava TaxID=63121 RepID=UPI00396A5AB6
MSKGLLCLVFLALVVLAAGKTITFKDCATAPPGKGVIKKIDVNPCPAEPCSLHKGTNVTVDVTFVAGENATTATSVVHGIIADVPVPFPLPHPDACKFGGLKCPVQSGTQYDYHAILFVDPIYPQLKLVVKWEVQDQSQKDLFCFEAPLQIVP